MDNKLKKTIRQMAESSSADPYEQDAFVKGAHEALDAVRGFLSVSSHLSETVSISDLREYINRIDC